MKVKFLGKTSFLVLTNGKVYPVVSVEKGWYRIIDDSGYDYLYPPVYFEVVENDTQTEECIEEEEGEEKTVDTASTIFVKSQKRGN